MKGDPQTLEAYALYFSKFVQAWPPEGINLYAIDPQNEMAELQRQHLSPMRWNQRGHERVRARPSRPALQGRQGVNVEVWLGTIIKPANEFVDPILGDPATRKMITGVGFQYEGSDALPGLTKSIPSKNSRRPRPSVTMAGTPGPRG